MRVGVNARRGGRSCEGLSSSRVISGKVGRKVRSEERETKV